ncbi:helix-turn-helix domain-containing protein [Marinilactibacillus psychrotolerans]|uniref:helix-turn-helix domain-containing protein n=1 Tax=Marinilactibacillus psychrotolerans TaxID=191770 RepID=UPI003888D1B3
MNKPKKLVVHLDKLLEEKNITQAQLARKAGIDPSRLSSLIRGKRERIQVEFLTLIAEALGIDKIEEILTLEDAESDEENKLIASKNVK